MKQPVRCTWCGRTYDLQAVEVVARYIDCSMWNAPCCGVLVDDRDWKFRADYVRISDDPQARLLDLGGSELVYFDTYGKMRRSR